MKPNIFFPKEESGQYEELSVDQNIVIIGANGSGKTRLGAWMEMKMPYDQLHRISAQRALTLPEIAPLKFLEEAQNELMYGINDIVQAQSKISYRWSGNPATMLISDYQRVLSALFAAHQARNNTYVKETKTDESDKKLPIPSSPLEQLIEVWDMIYPHRKIELSDGRVSVNLGTSTYHGKEMSDGERVALYLIGQCLCAPQNMVLLIDEPEIHLHRSIMNQLWDTLEILRSDCLFVYITHDLEFASSRIGIKKWIKEYNGEWWKIEDVPQVNDIPEELIMALIGNRKKVIFTEGERGSLDSAIYQALYPNHFIIPRGSCHKVIESTKAIRDTPGLHYLEVNGIIDRDYRTDEELEALRQSNIFALEVAEIENLLIVEEVVILMAEKNGYSKEEIFPRVKHEVFKSLSQELENQISLRSAQEIEFRLNTFNTRAKGKQALMDAKRVLLDSVDVEEIYNINETLFTDAIDTMNYKKVLQLYNRKSLFRLVATPMGMVSDGYKERFLRLIRSNEADEILNALHAYTPQIH